MLLFLTDRDECTEKNDTCAADEKCLNTIGSYSCNCAPGYTGGAGNCQGYLAVVVIFCRMGAVSNFAIWSFVCRYPYRSGPDCPKDG